MRLPSFRRAVTPDELAQLEHDRTAAWARVGWTRGKRESDAAWKSMIAASLRVDHAKDRAASTPTHTAQEG